MELDITGHPILAIVFFFAFGLMFYHQHLVDTHKKMKEMIFVIARESLTSQKMSSFMKEFGEDIFGKNYHKGGN